jgi:beta-galactosidase
MFLGQSEGGGLLVAGEQPLSMSAWHYRSSDLDPGKTKGQTHHGELRERPLTTLIIDYRQTGVGGEYCWGARPMAKYRLPYQPYAYAYWLIPVGNRDTLEEALTTIGYD